MLTHLDTPSATTQHSALSTQHAYDADTLLQASRRIDWRFLLPSPELGQVGIVGGVPDDLRTALEMFGESVSDVSSHTSYDLIVISHPTRQALKTAITHLKPGGHLYIEARSLLKRGRHAKVSDLRLARPAGLTAYLEAQGLQNARAYWHWPNFAACTKIVPLQDKGALQSTFVTGGRSKKAKMKAGVGKLLMLSGLVKDAVPNFSVIARKGARDEQQGADSLLSYLYENWQRLELDRYVPSKKLTAVLITPRFRASSHVVYLIMPAGKSDPVLVAKVPRLAGPSASVTREVANLRQIQASRPGGFDSIPTIIACEELAGHQFLLETALVGKPMDPPAVRHEPDKVCQVMTRWLIDLQTAAQNSRQTSTPDENSDWFDKLITQPIDTFGNLVPLTAQESDLLAKTRRLMEPLRHAEIPLVLEHGDLSHPNVMWLPDGQPGVVDWELAHMQGLPGFDLFFFLSYVAFARHGTRESGEHLHAFQASFFGPDAWTRPFINDYFAQLAIPTHLIKPLFVFTWLRYMSSLLRRLDEAPNSSGQLSQETAVWLRENRYYQLWQYAVEHAEEISEQ